MASLAKSRFEKGEAGNKPKVIEPKRKSVRKIKPKEEPPAEDVKAALTKTEKNAKPGVDDKALLSAETKTPEDSATSEGEGSTDGAESIQVTPDQSEGESKASSPEPSKRKSISKTPEPGDQGERRLSLTPTPDLSKRRSSKTPEPKEQVGELSTARRSSLKPPSKDKSPTPDKSHKNDEPKEKLTKKDKSKTPEPAALAKEPEKKEAARQSLKPPKNDKSKTPEPSTKSGKEEPEKSVTVVVESSEDDRGKSHTPDPVKKGVAFGETVVTEYDEEGNIIVTSKEPSAYQQLKDLVTGEEPEPEPEEKLIVREPIEVPADPVEYIDTGVTISLPESFWLWDEEVEELLVDFEKEVTVTEKSEIFPPEELPAEAMMMRSFLHNIVQKIVWVKTPKRLARIYINKIMNMVDWVEVPQRIVQPLIIECIIRAIPFTEAETMAFDMEELMVYEAVGHTPLEYICLDILDVCVDRACAPEPDEEEKLYRAARDKYRTWWDKDFKRPTTNLDILVKHQKDLVLGKMAELKKDLRDTGLEMRRLWMRPYREIVREKTFCVAEEDMADHMKVIAVSELNSPGRKAISYVCDNQAYVASQYKSLKYSGWRLEEEVQRMRNNYNLPNVVETYSYYKKSKERHRMKFGDITKPPGPSLWQP